MPKKQLTRQQQLQLVINDIANGFTVEWRPKSGWWAVNGSFSVFLGSDYFEAKITANQKMNYLISEGKSQC